VGFSGVVTKLSYRLELLGVASAGRVGTTNSASLGENMTYQPRTQSEKFLDGDCPKGVLAIYDNGGKTFDRYTVFYKPTEPLKDIYAPIGYRGMSEHPSDPQGFGQYGEMAAWEAREYRSSIYRDSCKWTDLPEDVQRCVRNDCSDLEVQAAGYAVELD
jgi:hypothetical protein